MFDRCPDASLVADLVPLQETPPVRDADLAAVDLIEQLVAWDRVAGWVESQRLATMRRFHTARVNADREWVPSPDLSPSQVAAIHRLRADFDEQAGKFAAEEIALALNISPTMAGKQLTLAQELTSVHRDLGDALELGHVSGFVASMVATATRQLPSAAREALDAAVTADAIELPTGRAITAARNRVTELDAAIADAACDRARGDRRAFFRPVEHGMALLGAVLPADDAIRAWDRIDDLARTCKAAGDPATLDQLRADLFTQALSAADLDTATDRGEAGRRARRPVTMQVTIALSSLLGLDSRCGRLDGYGAITPTTARHIMAAGDTTLKRLLVDPVTGAVITADPTRYRPDAATQHAVRCRDWQCRLPVCTARVRDLDHMTAFADGGLTIKTSLQGLCERSHLAKSHPGWSVTGDTDTVTTWHTPTGHHYRSLPPPATGHGTGPPNDHDNGLHDTLDLPAWATDQQHLRAQLRAWNQRRGQQAA